MKKNYMKRFLPIVLAVCLVSFVVGMAQASVQMPSFTLDSARDTSKISSADYSGKVLLVTFFATWCPPCIQEVPSLVELQDNYSQRGFSVIALSVDQTSPKTVHGFIKKKGINYPVAMADQAVMRDFGGVYGIPVAFLVNRRGEVVKRYTGYVAHDLLAKDITDLL